MNKTIFSVIFMTLVGTSVQAASVTIATSVICNTNLGSVTGSSSCTQAGTLDTVTASASDSYTISGNTVTFNSSVEASVSANPAGPSSDTASASTFLSLYFVTSGPIRSGIVYVPAFDASGVGETGVTSTASFILSDTLGGMCGTKLGCVFPPVYEPYQVTLGTTLELTEMSSTYAGAFNEGEMGSLGALDFGGTLEFFEADGVTPVDVSAATPEPTTLGLLLLVVALSAGGVRLCPKLCPPLATLRYHPKLSKPNKNVVNCSLLTSYSQS